MDVASDVVGFAHSTVLWTAIDSLPSAGWGCRKIANDLCGTLEGCDSGWTRELQGIESAGPRPLSQRPPYSGL